MYYVPLYLWPTTTDMQANSYGFFQDSNNPLHQSSSILYEKYLHIFKAHQEEIQITPH